MNAGGTYREEGGGKEGDWWLWGSAIIRIHFVPVGTVTEQSQRSKSPPVSPDFNSFWNRT